ncbi:MAG: glycosyltransferase [Magnetococcales bacterium]|nr:glycosyltransferase [Magnetococcales bacterium]
MVDMNAKNGLTPTDELLWGPAALTDRREKCRVHQGKMAAKRSIWINRNGYYYQEIKRLFQFVAEPGRKVLHMRCETGVLLEYLRPSKGLGVDVSEKMVEQAKRNYGHRFDFQVSDPEDFTSSETFDIILFNAVNDTVDVLAAFRRMRAVCEPHTRLMLYTHSNSWKHILKLGEKIGLKVPTLEQNWLNMKDLEGFLNLGGFQLVRVYRTILLPFWIPFLSTFFNHVLGRLPIINNLCMVNMLIARPIFPPLSPEEVSVSVIIPCKNEKDNIQAAVQRIPEMGKSTEIIFCDDKSTDGTREEIQRVQAIHNHRTIRLLDGPGICKSENVWTGFNGASGDILMILDGDLTVMPEELPDFFRAMLQRKGEMINGVRLVYPVPKTAMPTFNLIGNKAFSVLFSLALGQTVKDTLCGTKVIWRRDWERIRPLVGSWGTQDRWGDYDILFGASKLTLLITDLPVHYQERVFGITKMVRVFQNGVTMLRITLNATMKLRFGF